MKYTLTIGILFLYLCSHAQMVGVLSAKTSNTTILKNGVVAKAQSQQKLYTGETIIFPGTESVTVTCMANDPLIFNRQTIPTLNKKLRQLSGDTITTGVAIKIPGAAVQKLCTAPEEHLLLAIIKSLLIPTHKRETTANVHASTVRNRGCADSTRQAFDTICYHNGELIVTLKRRGKTGQTLFNIYAGEADTEPMRSIGAKDNRFSFSSMGKLPAGTMFWAIENGYDHCTKNRLEIMDNATFETLYTKYANEVNLLFDASAERAYIMARLFEKDHLLADAWHYYQQAATADKKYTKARDAFKTYYNVIE